MSLIDLSGPLFLLFYLPLLFGGFLAAYRLQRRMLGPDDEGGPTARELHPYEVAFLEKGAPRAADTALVSLVKRGLLTYEAGTKRLIKAGTSDTPRPGHPFERAILDDVPGQGVGLAHVHSLARTMADGFFTQDLRKRELLPSESRQLGLWLLPTCILGAIFFLGFAKLFIGVGRARPVMFLMISLLLGVMGSAHLLILHPFQRTRRATRVLEALRRENAALATVSKSLEPRESELPMLVALFGIGSVYLPSLDALQTSLVEMTSPPSSSSAWADDGGGDGGGCGGGCGGCGGCGG